MISVKKAYIRVAISIVTCKIDIKDFFELTLCRNVALSPVSILAGY